jgi:hypothetical protein
MTTCTRRRAVLLAAAVAVLRPAPTRAHEPDLTRLPLGDGKISDAPRRGWIWACRVDPNGGGADRNGPWIKEDGTFDFTAKAVVAGSVSWPHAFRVARESDRREFSTNDYPSHPTGKFPINPDSEAYRYDRNPNRIRGQSIAFELPADPVPAEAPSCAPGAVGILLSGAVLFNALDAPGRDAVAHETQDSCQGHPQESGVYHYHSLSTCVPDEVDATGHSKLVGYALDGFGIYGRHGEGGKILTSADLDECHGHTHEILWDGKKVVMYHYHATWDFPYTVGCLRGAYDRSVVRAISGPPPGRGGPGGPGPGGRRRPDLNAAAEKLGIPVERLRAALGPPPPDLDAAARRLGIDEDALRDALGAPDDRR